MRRALVQRFAGASLRLRLIVLVLIPVLGLTLLTVFNVAGRLHSARTAAEANSLVEDAAAIDHLRVGLQQEIIPSMGLAVLTDDAARRRLGLTVPIDVGATRRNVTKLRKETDSALAAATSRASLRDDLTSTAGNIAKVRNLLGKVSLTGTNMNDSLKIVATLARLEQDKVNRAMRLGLDGGTVTTLQDLSLTMQVGVAASQLSGTFVATSLAPDPSHLASYQAEAQLNWADYQAAAKQITLAGSDVINADWKSLRASHEVAPFDALIQKNLSAKAAASSARITDAIRVFTLDAPRNEAFSRLLQSATARATASTHRLETANHRALWWSVILSGALDLLVFALVVFVNRSITRPLEVVAMQARRLSEGELTTVPVQGPREVQTVGRGLEAAVGSLQRIQDTAKAVAENDLDSPALAEPMPGRLGEVIHASMGRIVDAINAQEVAQRELAHRAAHDALTELPNRAQALANIEQALKRAARAGWTTALLFIDLDRFKAVNDTLGHQAGDEVLRISAERMRSIVRDGDMVARLGGDEFVILLEHIDLEMNFVALAERLVGSLSEPMTVMGHSVDVGASVGIAISQDGQTEASVLLKEADAAVYEAKRSGRGRVDVFDERLRSLLTFRAELDEAMRHALAHDEFELYYQPVVELGTGATRSIEALIRWNRPGLGVVPPDRFIPTAELSPIINDIGRWTLRHATRQLKEWMAAGPTGGLAVAVNISGRHLSSPELVDDVRSALAESQVDPERLTLEITETVVLDDPRALSNMTQLRQLGVKLALDDFGTGYTSIGQLARLPVDIVKIDRSFTSSTDETHRALVALMVTAAHTFGMEVVAEGIETAVQAQDLRDALADTGQGYYFARPAPAAQDAPVARFELPGR